MIQRLTNKVKRFKFLSEGLGLGGPISGIPKGESFKSDQQTASPSRKRLVKDQRGGVLVMVAVFLPILIAFGSFTLDTANWWVHKRHLQTQADAAALAAAAEFNNCNDANIQNIVNKYSGVQSTSHNQQIGKTPISKVHALINSPTYYNQTKVDPDIKGSSPCATKMIDVKMTETDVPWFFKLANVNYINATARVSLRNLNQFQGMLPFGVPESTPKIAKAWFINEDNGQVIGQTDLDRKPNANGMTMWSNASSALPVNVNTDHIGVKIALSNSYSFDCSDSGVNCYDGVDYIHGWSSSPTVSNDKAPEVRDATMLSGTCNDAYFVSQNTSCSVGLTAKVDFAPNVGGTNKETLTASVDGKDYPLSFSNGNWTTGNVIPVAPLAGPLPVTLKWEQTGGKIGGDTCKAGNKNPCTGSFGIVQRTFSATPDKSGPIKLLQVSEQDSSGGITTAANSLQKCTDGSSCHKMVVTVGLPSLEISKPTDPPVRIRVGGGGSQNQTVDCEPGGNLFDEVANGCTPQYKVNTGESCAGSTQSLWGSPGPWACVAAQTGADVNAISKGLNERILCKPTPGNCKQVGKPTECTAPNNWPNYQSNDPRILPLFVVPNGSFGNSGSENFAVDNFAFFYITGWKGSGNGFDNPCEGKGDDPVSDSGEITGHFIKYISPPSRGSGGDETCDFNSIGGCIAELTK